MEIQSLSKTYKVSRLDVTSIPSILRLCDGNPIYYRYAPPAASKESIEEEMSALPKGKESKDKYYLGFWDNGKLAAVMDLIVKYPDAKTAWIGFFMMDAAMQGKGNGSRLIEEICCCLKRDFSFIELGYVKGNLQSEHFWLKNKFHPTGKVSQTENYEIIVLQRPL